MPQVTAQGIEFPRTPSMPPATKPDALLFRQIQHHVGRDISSSRLRCIASFAAAPGQPQKRSRQRRRDNPASSAHTASKTNQIRLHAGIAKPRKVQSTLAHSPEPVNTLRITSAKGKACIM